MSAHILFYGTYPILLETHNVILQRSGFTVRKADSFAKYRALLDRENVDLCILCSSLTTEERDQAIAALNILHPETPYMVLSPSVPRFSKHARESAINCLAGPEFLLDRVRESLPAPVHA